MKLSISNIGWTKENDLTVYEMMKNKGYEGLEIAPTRIFPEHPYDRIEEANEWAKELKAGNGFVIPSMQSIWYGRSEKLFGTDEERAALADYTKKAIDFAESIGCRNLVFGCPRNRNMPDGADENTAVVFFREMGEYAAEHNTVIGMEANPPIYNTNYINDTKSALDLIEEVGSKGFKLNLDVIMQVGLVKMKMDFLGRSGDRGREHKNISKNDRLRRGTTREWDKRNTSKKYGRVRNQSN